MGFLWLRVDTGYLTKSHPPPFSESGFVIHMRSIRTYTFSVVRWYLSTFVPFSVRAFGMRFEQDHHQCAVETAALL